MVVTWVLGFQAIYYFLYFSLKESILPLKPGDVIQLNFFTKKNQVPLMPAFKDFLSMWSNISICDILTLTAFRWC